MQNRWRPCLKANPIRLCDSVRQFGKVQVRFTAFDRGIERSIILALPLSLMASSAFCSRRLRSEGSSVVPETATGVTKAVADAVARTLVSCCARLSQRSAIRLIQKLSLRSTQVGTGSPALLTKCLVRMAGLLTHPFKHVRAFQVLFNQLDQVTGTKAKVQALVDHFQAVAPAEAAWALTLLLGKRRRRLITGRRLRDILRDRGGLPDWLIDDCYGQVGDSAETISLLWPAVQERLEGSDRTSQL